MIGIFAPYNHNEVTAAALRLAELSVTLYGSARFIAVNGCARHVHPAWDQRVHSLRGDSPYRAARGCTHFVHLELDPAWRVIADLVSPNAKHILVPQWHHLHEFHASEIAHYNSIVCPTKACHRAVVETFFKEEVPLPVTWCRVDAGLPVARREGLVADRQIRAAIWADYTSIDYCGPLVLRLIECILQLVPHSHLTVLSVKSWCRQDRRRLRDLLQRWPDRLKCKYGLSLVAQDAEFHEHDWVIFPSVLSNFGISALRALACGAAVIAYETEPWSELIDPNRHGVLVPCTVRSNWSGATEVLPVIGPMEEHCVSAMSDNRLLFNLQSRDWHLPALQHSFTDFWTKQLASE